MQEFLTDLFKYNFLQYALIAGILASISSGIIGSFVTVRRISSVAGAIAHSTLGGMGLFLFLNRNLGFTYLTPLYGALSSAIVSAIIIGVITLYGKQRESTVLNVVWSVGMAIGIVFISQTKGFNEDLMSYLFGNILMVTKNDIILIIILDICVLFFSIIFYYKFLAICFDEEFASIRGVNVGFYYILLLCLVGLTVVILSQVVGIVMVIALLSIPPATASSFSKKLVHMMILSIIISMISIFLGLSLSYKPDLPAGASIILISGLIYIIVLIMKTISTKIKKELFSK